MVADYGRSASLDFALRSLRRMKNVQMQDGMLRAVLHEHWVGEVGAEETDRLEVRTGVWVIRTCLNGAKQCAIITCGTL